MTKSELIKAYMQEVSADVTNKAEARVQKSAAKGGIELCIRQVRSTAVSNTSYEPFVNYVTLFLGSTTPPPYPAI